MDEVTYKAIDAIFGKACVGNDPFDAGDISIDAIKELYNMDYLAAHKLFWEWLNENAKRRAS